MEVSNLSVEEYRTTMLHDDMTPARLIVYAQSIEESKLRRMARSLKIVVLVTETTQDLITWLNLKKNLRVLRLNWRKVVVLKMSKLHVPLVA